MLRVCVASTQVSQVAMPMAFCTLAIIVSIQQLCMFCKWMGLLHTMVQAEDTPIKPAPSASSSAV